MRTEAKIAFVIVAVVVTGVLIYFSTNRDERIPLASSPAEAVSSSEAAKSSETTAEPLVLTPAEPAKTSAGETPAPVSVQKIDFEQLHKSDPTAPSRIPVVGGAAKPTGSVTLDLEGNRRSTTAPAPVSLESGVQIETIHAGKTTVKGSKTGKTSVVGGKVQANQPVSIDNADTDSGAMVDVDGIRSGNTRGNVKFHTVASGETMSSISTKYYGRADRWAEIAKANPQLDHPGRLKVGQKITIPAVEQSSVAGANVSGEKTSAEATAKKTDATDKKSETSADSGKTRTYRVQNGDTFYSIARDHLGAGTRWKEIYNLNRNRVSSPSKIRPGMTIVLPAKK